MSEYSAGRVFLHARTQKQWSQIRVAKALGVTKSHISMIESDDRNPSWDLICRLSEACEIPLPVLIGDAFAKEKKA